MTLTKNLLWSMMSWFFLINMDSWKTLTEMLWIQLQYVSEPIEGQIGTEQTVINFSFKNFLLFFFFYFFYSRTILLSKCVHTYSNPAFPLVSKAHNHPRHLPVAKVPYFNSTSVDKSRNINWLGPGRHHPQFQWVAWTV